MPTRKNSPTVQIFVRRDWTTDAWVAEITVLDPSGAELERHEHRYGPLYEADQAERLVFAAAQRHLRRWLSVWPREASDT